MPFLPVRPRTKEDIDEFGILNNIHEVVDEVSLGVEEDFQLQDAWLSMADNAEIRDESTSRLESLGTGAP